MAGKQAAPLPGQAVTSRHVVAGPPTTNYQTSAIRDRSATWSPRSQPMRPGRIQIRLWVVAGLPADDPVLGDRLGRGHGAAQPAAATTPRPPTIPSHCWQRLE